MAVIQYSLWLCEHCGATNETPIDLSGLHHQEMTEDCTVCCRPSLLRIDIDCERQEATVRASKENS